jgi:hypothetical protein
MLEDNVVQQYNYLYLQISQMTEVLRLHDNCERIIEESARNSLIKIRASEFSKLARIIEQYPEAHEWYKEKYR